MPRKTIAFFFNLVASALASTIISVLIMGNSIQNIVFYIALASLGVSTILTVTFEREKFSNINWWWHRIWLLAELRKEYLALLENDLGEVEAKRLTSTDKSHIQLFTGTEQEEDVTLFVTKWLNSNPADRIMITGKAGLGKSTALLHSLHKLSNLSFKSLGIKVPVPLLVRCENYSGNLLSFLQADLEKLTVGESGRVAGKNIDWLLRKGKILVVLDAIDRVPENHRGEFLMEIERFVSLPAYKKSSFLMSCRDVYIETMTSSRRLNLITYQLKELENEGVRALIEIYKKEEDSTESVFQKLEDGQLLTSDGLARIPYWLRLIVKVELFESNSTKLLDDTLERLLLTEFQSPNAKIKWQKKLPVETQIRQTRMTLAIFAYQLVTLGKYKLDYPEAHKAISDTLASQNYKEISADDVIGLAQDSQILSDSHSEKIAGRPVSISFRHSLLLEYLAASAIFLYSQYLSLDKVREYISTPSKWWNILNFFNRMVQRGGTRETSEKKREFESYLEKASDIVDGKLAAFFLLDWTDRILENDEYMVVEEGIAELLSKDIDDDRLPTYSKLAQLLPRDFIKLLSKIYESKPNSVGIKKVVMHLIKQQAENEQISALLIQIANNKFLKPIAVNYFTDKTQDSVPVLLKLIYTEADDTAFESLAVLRDSRAIQPLCDLLRTIPVVNVEFAEEIKETLYYLGISSRDRAIIKTLGEIADPVAIPSIIGALEKSEEKYSYHSMLVEQDALDSIAKMGLPGVHTLLNVVAKMTPTDVELSKIPKLLASIGNDAVPILMDGLHHKRPSVRFACVESLGLLKCNGAIEMLAEIIEKDEFIVRNKAISMLGLIGVNAAPALIKALDRDTGIEKPKTWNYFLYIKRDHARYTNAKITGVLGRLGSEILPQLLTATQSDNKAVKLSAVEAIGAIGDKRAYKRLVEIIETSDDVNLRLQAISAMGGVGSNAALKFLKEYAESHQGDKRIFVAVVSAFARTGNQVGVDHLIKIVENGQDYEEPLDSLFRLQAVTGLYIANRQESIPAMNQFITYLQTKKVKGYKDTIKTVQSVIKGLEAKDYLEKSKQDEKANEA